MLVKSENFQCQIFVDKVSDQFLSAFLVFCGVFFFIAGTVVKRFVVIYLQT